MNSRTVYSIIGVFGDVGGVISCLSIMLALFLSPYSEICFRMKAISDLCLIETKDKIEYIQFTFKDKIAYYFFGCCHKKRMAIIDKGSELIEKQMDVVELLLTVK